jgi:sugar phosphate isomerase/epimerase
MKLGITIRHDMGENNIIKNTDTLIHFLKKFGNNLGFIEIYCAYPLPVNLFDGLDKLRSFLDKKNIEVGLHFPVEWHDRWKTRMSYPDVVSIMLGFARKMDAKYINVHPDDLGHFIGSKDKFAIKRVLYDIKERCACTLVVENGHSVFQNPQDLAFFTDNGIKMTLDLCHTFQAKLTYNEFRKSLPGLSRKLFLAHISDLGERAHMELGCGKIPFQKIIRNLKKFDMYGLCFETLLTIENELIIRNPLIATKNSIDYLKRLT